MEHRKKRKTRKCKLKLGKTLAEIAENAERFDKLKLGFIFSQKSRKKMCHVSQVLHGLGKLKLGWRTDTNEMTWGRFFSHELPRIIREWLALVLMSRRKRGKRRFYYPLSITYNQ
jgi:hypothetical protein